MKLQTEAFTREVVAVSHLDKLLLRFHSFCHLLANCLGLHVCDEPTSHGQTDVCLQESPPDLFHWLFNIL